MVEGKKKNVFRIRVTLSPPTLFLFSSADVSGPRKREKKEAESVGETTRNEIKRGGGERALRYQA